MKLTFQNRGGSKRASGGCQENKSELHFEQQKKLDEWDKAMK